MDSFVSLDTEIPSYKQRLKVCTLMQNLSFYKLGSLEKKKQTEDTTYYLAF